MDPATLLSLNQISTAHWKTGPQNRAIDQQLKPLWNGPLNSTAYADLRKKTQDLEKHPDNQRLEHIPSLRCGITLGSQHSGPKPVLLSNVLQAYKDKQ